MTVQNTGNRKTHTGDGTSTAFAFPYKFLAAADLKVYANGVLMTLTTDYTVGTPTDSGANVTFNVAPAYGVPVIIFNSPDFLQQSKLPSTGPFPAKTVETMVDKVTLIAQYLATQVSRSLRLNDSDSVTLSTQLPTYQASTLLGWGPDAGSGLQNIDPTTLATIVAFGTARADLFDGTGAQTTFTLSSNPGAQANLDISIGGVTQYPGIDYTWSGGTSLVFAVPPPLGAKVLARYFLGLPQGTTDSAASTFLPVGTGAVQRDVQSKLRDIVDVRDYGAKGDGVTDDSAAVQKAFNAARMVTARGGTWRIANTVTPGAYRALDILGSDIVADTGSNPLFSFTGGLEGFAVRHGGGMIRGTCSDVFFFEGTTDQPTNNGQYARQIRLKDIHVTSPTITRFATFSKACRQVFIDGCFTYTQNCAFLNGKNVEFFISNSEFYSSTGGVGTYGIKTRSTGGTTYFNEGISIINCTIDEFEICHDVTDVFGYWAIGGYHGANAALATSSARAFQIQAPSTNLCDSIIIDGGIELNGAVEFLGSAGGVAYSAKIHALFTGVNGTCVRLGNNASLIDIDIVCKAGTGAAIGVVGVGNNNGITAKCKVDGTYSNAVILNGAAGTDCVIGPVSGPSSGGLAGAARAVLLQGVPINTASVANLIRTVSASNLGNGATYAVGVTIGSLAWVFAKGERGDIILNLPYSGANASTQGLQISLPSGMTLESGSGWAANNIYLGAASGLCSVRVPYRCTADGGGNITVTNLAGNTITINNQAWIGLHKDI